MKFLGYVVATIILAIYGGFYVFLFSSIFMRFWNM